MVLRSNPAGANPPRWVGPGKWREEKIPKYVSHLPKQLQSLFNQVGFSLKVENVGRRVRLKPE